MDGMPVCDGCGCVVHPQLLKRHQQFHEDLLTEEKLKTQLPRSPLANANRTRVQDC